MMKIPGLIGFAALAVAVVAGSAGCAPEKDDPFAAPNDTFEQAIPIPAEDGWSHDGLTLCAGCSDFFELQVEPGNLVYVEITFENGDGDGDLVLDVYDTNQKRLNQSDSGLNYERVAVLDAAATEPRTYVLEVSGYQGGFGDYTIATRSFPYEEAKDCAGDDCKRIMQFPAPHVEDHYRFDSATEYQNARRELIMLVRYALQKTYERYPDQEPLGLIDMSERDGKTPGSAYDDLRHPEGTHVEGNDMDIAYFQTGPNNRARTICPDDGYFCTSETNTLNAEVQAYFMAQLFSSTNVRVIGVDTTFVDDLQIAAESLKQSGAISNAQRMSFDNYIGYGSGWPFHQHHLHLSLDWDEGYELRAGNAQHAINPYQF